MSTTIPNHENPPPAVKLKVIAMDSSKEAKNDSTELHKNYKGFVAGVFSGIGKLTGKSLIILNFT
jgi:hypothetical protein